MVNGGVVSVVSPRLMDTLITGMGAAPLQVGMEWRQRVTRGEGGRGLDGKLGI